MKIALRRSAPVNATPWQRFASWIIRARLVSQYSHAGIVVDGRLLHATAANGLHAIEAGDWSPERWDIIDIGGNDDSALALFQRYEGAQYDWFSLLAFVGLRARDSQRMYCFEWCWLAMTGSIPTEHITPEMLLLAAIESSTQSPIHYSPGDQGKHPVSTEKFLFDEIV